jgi:hypothetical protein
MYFMRSLALLLLAVMIGWNGAALAADKTTNSSKIERYPTEAAKSLYEGCVKSKSTPADRAKPICSCYIAIIQGTVPYSVFQKTNADLKAKGFDGLDADGKAAMEKNRYAADYCRLKHDAANATEERGTFPDDALPALHASCMDFKDVPDAKKQTFCACYETLVRTKISYSDWRLLGLAIQTKGINQLDGEEAHILSAVRDAKLSCGGGAK